MPVTETDAGPPRDDPRLWKQAGLQALHHGTNRTAAAAFQRWCALQPDSADAWLHLVITDTGLGFRRAGAFLGRVLALEPDSVGGRWWLAEFYAATGAPGDAAKQWRLMADRHPDEAEYRIRQGLAHRAAGQEIAASQAFLDALTRFERDAQAADPQAAALRLRHAHCLWLLGRQKEASRLIEDVNGRAAATDLRFAEPRYRAGTAEALAGLRNMVNGRVIVILGSGPSLRMLDAVLDRVSPDRLCFFGFNQVVGAEELVERRCGRRLDLACMTAAETIETQAAWLRDFLSADRPTCFMTSVGLATLAPLAAGSQRLLCFASDSTHFPHSGDPLHLVGTINALAIVIAMAVLAQPSAIVLFGCDGAVATGPQGLEALYFDGMIEPQRYEEDFVNSYAHWLARDTALLNNLLPIILMAAATLHRVPMPRIANCCPTSAINIFPRLGVEETVAMMTTAVN